MYAKPVPPSLVRETMYEVLTKSHFYNEVVGLRASTWYKILTQVTGTYTCIFLDSKKFIRPTSSPPGFLRKEGHPEVLYKPVQSGVKGPREVMFYETMFGGESWCIVWSCDYHLTVSYALAGVCIHWVGSEGSRQCFLFVPPPLPPSLPPLPPSFLPSPLPPSLSPPLSSLPDDINVESLPEDIQQLRTIIPRYLGTANIRDRAGHIRILSKPLFWNAGAVGYQHIHKQS